MTNYVLITGINGIIGRAINRGLDDQREIFGLDLVAKPRKGVFPADISDQSALRGVFKKLPQIESIIHLAADSYPFASWELVLRHNVLGTKNVYDCAREFGVKRVIFASSTHVVGRYPGYPAALEDRKMLYSVDPVRPDGWYGASKAMGEVIARTYFDLQGLESIILRIGHVTADDDNSEEDLRKLFLSKYDLLNLVRGSLETKTAFGIYFAVSDVPGRFLDLENAASDLDYLPTKYSA